MAGMLSIAKTRSDHSTRITTRMSGVARRRPREVREKNLVPSYESENGNTFRASLTMGFRSGSIRSSRPSSIRMPVIDQNATENVDDPLEPLQQQRAQPDHDQPHHDRAQDAPLEHLRLRLGRHAEVTEDQDEDEEVVDAEGELDQVPGVVLERMLRALPPPENSAEQQGEDDEPAAPAHRLLDRQDVGPPVEDAQVEDQQAPRPGR